jgi:uncharacterized protein YkvS
MKIINTKNALILLKAKNILKISHVGKIINKSNLF